MKLVQEYKKAVSSLAEKIVSGDRLFGGLMGASIGAWTGAAANGAILLYSLNSSEFPNFLPFQPFIIAGAAVGLTLGTKKVLEMLGHKENLDPTSTSAKSNPPLDYHI